MKKIKNINKILENTGLIDELIKTVSKILKIDEEKAKIIVDSRSNYVFNKIGKEIKEGQYQIQKKDLESKILDSDNNDIFNNENIIKDK